LSAAGADGDWVDEAAALIERFEKVSTDPVPPLVRQEQYLELLDEVGKFSQAPGPDEREGKGRKAFGLLLSGRIHEQLGNGLAAVRCWQAHRQERDALPEADRAALGPLFEHAERAAELDAPRVCQVEARGNEVRVRAVDYPIEALLAKLSEATGERIEVAPQVSGVVDCVREDWHRVDGWLTLFCLPRGLCDKGQLGQALSVGPCEPSYMLAIGERAESRIRDLALEAPETGITSGYAILSGHYLPPPYKVEVRTTEDKCEVYINGVPVGQPEPFRPSPSKRVLSPAAGKFESHGQLTVYIGQEFADVRASHGKEEARKRIEQVLKQQGGLKSYKFNDDLTRIELVFEDGDRQGVLVNTFKPTRTPRKDGGEDSKEEQQQREEVDRRRQQAVKRSQERADRIAKALNANGLVIACSSGQMSISSGAEASKRLLAMCNALHEAQRQNEQLAAALFSSLRQDSPDCASELFLNLRHRELWERLREEVAMPAEQR
jgi:hypothetical protein